MAVSLGHPAQANFIVNSAILEFTADGSRQQDIELLSRSASNDYAVADIYEVEHPGAASEVRRLIDDPHQSMLLVTPDKSILSAGGRKILRFVLLKNPDAQEHIFRVAVKPVIKGLDSNKKVGLKILVGYEILVTVRPAKPAPAFTASRHGRTFEVTNILLQNGQQCASAQSCKIAPVIRVYAGRKPTTNWRRIRR